MKIMLAIAYLLIGVLFIMTSARAQQTLCYSLGADMEQCTNGAWSMRMGDMVLVTPPPSIEPLPPSYFQYAPLLTIEELVSAVRQAKIDCMRQDPLAGACDKRMSIEAELTARNMCFGHVGQANADARWERCRR